MAKAGLAVRLVSMTLLAAAVLSVAWVAEDAYITFRTADNFLDGFGLRWNPDERVQSYTHPLWMFVLAASGLVTRNLFLSSIALNVFCTLAAAGLIAFRIARSSWHAFFAISILAGSMAFRDFSTSGLENAFAHLLLTTFLWLASSRERPPMAALALLLSAICLNRLDHAVIAGPVFALCFHRDRDVRGVIVSAIPFIAWESFSICYYGVPFPNTAYAKLSTGLEPDWLLRHGLLYLRNSIVWDPLTLTAIAAAALAAAFSRRAADRAVAIGVACYIAYVIQIGGDFMSGRFLTAPLVGAVILLARASFGWLRPLTQGLALAAVAALGLAGLREHPGWDEADVADERRFYAGLSLARYQPGPDFPVHPFHDSAKVDIGSGKRVIIRGNIGIAGYKIGRRSHIVDPLALSDPLLARLPMQPHPWRVGHYERIDPVGYVESLESGKNQISDAGLARLWDDLVLLTRAPLTAPGRWAAIWRVNTGAHDAAVREWAAPETIPYGDLSIRRITDFRGAEVAFPVESTASVEIDCEGDDFYFITFLRGTKRLGGVDIKPEADRRKELRGVRVTPPPEAAGGFDSIRVSPRLGDRSYRVGRVMLVR